MCGLMVWSCLQGGFEPPPPPPPLRTSLRLCTDQLLELGLGASTKARKGLADRARSRARASTKARTGLALGLGLGPGLTVGLEIVLVRIISVDSLGHCRGICGAKAIQFGWGMVGESPVDMP